MRKILVPLAVAALVAGGLAGCGADFTPKGTVIEKDYDPATRKARADWDITVRKADGTEVEWEVSRSVYDVCQVDNPLTPRREPFSTFNGKRCV